MILAQVQRLAVYHCSVTRSFVPASPSPPTCTVSNGRAVVHLNRPKHRNRIEPADLVVLREILYQVHVNHSVRVFILTAVGDTFSAGFDLRALAVAAHQPHAVSMVDDLPALIDQVERCRVPTICGLNGSVYGGASDLALACDFRVGVASARMAVPAAALGLHYYHGGLRRFVTRLGLGAAKRLLLLGETIDSSEMLRIGFLDEIVDSTKTLHRRIHALADSLDAVPSPLVLTGMKRALNQLALGDMSPGGTDAAWSASVRSPEVAAAAVERLRYHRHIRDREKK